MRCHVLKWHWDIWVGGLFFLSCPRNCKKIKTLRSNIAAIFSSCVLHLWESAAAIPHRAICEGDSTRTRPFRNRTDHAFIRFPSQSSRKLRKLCQRQASFPTSGLGLWLGWGSSVEESWSNTRPDRCIALERQKNTDAPRGFGGIRKSLSFRALLFFRLENKRGSCIMTSDQMTVSEVNIQSLILRVLMQFHAFWLS